MCPIVIFVKSPKVAKARTRNATIDAAGIFAKETLSMQILLSSSGVACQQLSRIKLKGN
jgi:hypothetical protein